MPRIAKWEEKRECIKMSPKPVKFVFENFDTIADKSRTYYLYDKTQKVSWNSLQDSDLADLIKDGDNEPFLETFINNVLNIQGQSTEK